MGAPRSSTSRGSLISSNLGLVRGARLSKYSNLRKIYNFSNPAFLLHIENFIRTFVSGIFAKHGFFIATPVIREYASSSHSTFGGAYRFSAFLIEFNYWSPDLSVRFFDFNSFSPISSKSHLQTYSKILLGDVKNFDPGSLGPGFYRVNPSFSKSSLGFYL